ncbi:MAG: hypothetical protein JST09_05045 [Bacteroidetes bacterium]|nr:hypothetical protein [Bacteroidota bacterium]
MSKIYHIPQSKPPMLERFGLYYLQFFKKIDSSHNVFDLTDEELTKRVKHITLKGIILSSLIGIVCVFPTVWVDIHFADRPFMEHYGWVAGVTLVSIVIELYVLFLIALKAVYEVSEIINMHASQSDLVNDGVFSVPHILARTALELPDPELKILGVDPFKRISKKNLFILSLLYKAKIFVTNLVVKNTLLATVGKAIAGISVLYEALPVECFWNSVVIKRVVHEARLRLFGFALANQIAKNVIKDHIIEQLSPEAKTGCLRAIGNAVVMAQNYHPNMIILLIRFQQVLQVEKENKYDDWNLFLATLKNVSAKERYFLLDLFTVAAAFDGKISHLEEDNLQAAYADDYADYYPRLQLLTHLLRSGKINAALNLCKLDFEKG